MTITIEQIEKLPKWAQEHIRQLEGQRNSAVRALQRFCESNSTGAIVAPQLVCDSSPPSHREARYNWHNLEVRHVGVRLRITLYDDRINLSYTSESRELDYVYFTPASFQQFNLSMRGR